MSTVEYMKLFHQSYGYFEIKYIQMLSLSKTKISTGHCRKAHVINEG